VAAQFHQENFRREAYQGSASSQLWPARKDGSTDRALLVGDGGGRKNRNAPGRLRRAMLSPRTRGSDTEFVAPIYAKVHNYGLRAGRGRGFVMPRRQFAGPSRVLKARFHRKASSLITNQLNRIS
jgi:hypothetical protein